MTSQYRIVVTTIVVWLGMYLSTATAVYAQSCDTASAVARVESVQGSVTLNQTPVTQDALVCAGDWVDVGPFSRIALRLFATQTTLRIDEKTRIRIRPSARQGESLLDLLKGIVYLFSREPRKLDVYTPYVNAAVEGTEFLVRVVPSRSFVTVFEGRVLASNNQGEVRVEPNQTAVAQAGQAPRLIEIVTPEDSVQWALYYQPILYTLTDPLDRTERSYTSINDVRSALNRLEAAPERQRDEQYYVYQAGLLLSVGQSDAANAALVRAQRLNPNSTDAAALQAIIAVTKNDKERAYKLASSAVERDPNSVAARLALSYAQQARFELDEALTNVQAAADYDPDNAYTQARLAELWLAKGELRKARQVADQAVSLNPDLARTQSVLGFANLARIDVAAAQQNFTRAIELDQVDPLPRLGLGLAKIRSGQLEQGREEIEIAVSLDPGNSLLRSYLGKAYFEENRNELAGEQLALAKELDPFDPTPWLYDAIRKQNNNQPVDALQDLQKSIELNDNRAVYRSQLLLDGDYAARSVSLARIYEDLGFDQLAINESSQSLAIDPGNFSAHNFLADSYAKRPRHEAARVSEIFQAQVMQPISLNPVQPEQLETDLRIAEGAGFSEVGFNEFTPLFVSDDFRVSFTGLVGSHDTEGEQVTVSGVKDRFSYSVGQLHYGSDGFRENNDLQHNLFNVFGQVALTDQLSLQAEYRHRDTEEGDLRLNFDPEDFDDSLRRNIEQDFYRIASNYEINPQSNLLFSWIKNDRRENLRIRDAQNSVVESFLREEGHDFQIQYQHKAEQYNVLFGYGRYQSDGIKNLDISFNPPIQIPSMIINGNISPAQTISKISSFTKIERSLSEGYVYTNIFPSSDLIWTLGLSHASFENKTDSNVQLDKFLPKLGVRWRLFDNVNLRFGVFKSIKRSLIFDETLEPTHIAGFEQIFDDFNGTVSERYGIGADFRIGKSLHSGIEWSRRNLEVPRIIGTEVDFEDQREDRFSAYLYWTSNFDWAVSGSFQYERLRRKPAVSSGEMAESNLPLDVKTIKVPTVLKYFKDRFFSEFRATYVKQEIDSNTGNRLNNKDSFFIADASLGYRLPRQKGTLSIAMNNIFDKEFLFSDDNIQTRDPGKPLFIPERTVFARLVLNF